MVKQVDSIINSFYILRFLENSRGEYVFALLKIVDFRAYIRKLLGSFSGP